MATYKDIQGWIQRNDGALPASCWIAHVKELNGIPLRSTRDKPRIRPCPDNWRPVIENALRHFGILPPQ